MTKINKNSNNNNLDNHPLSGTAQQVIVIDDNSDTDEEVEVENAFDDSSDEDISDKKDQPNQVLNAQNTAPNDPMEIDNSQYQFSSNVSTYLDYFFPRIDGLLNRKFSNPNNTKYFFNYFNGNFYLSQKLDTATQTFIRLCFEELREIKDFLIRIIMITNTLDDSMKKDIDSFFKLTTGPMIKNQNVYLEIAEKIVAIYAGQYYLCRETEYNNTLSSTTQTTLTSAYSNGSSALWRAGNDANNNNNNNGSSNKSRFTSSM